jgi:hypothetical protein
VALAVLGVLASFGSIALANRSPVWMDERGREELELR